MHANIWREAGPPYRGTYPTTRQLGNCKPDTTIPSPYTSLPSAADRWELFRQLQRCRTGHSYSGEYYRRFVPSADSACPCGEPIQTREHVIQSCLTCEKHRTAQRKVSQMLYLPDLLGTKDGIEAMTSFLENSGTFTKNGQSLHHNPHPTWQTGLLRTEPQTPS